MHCVDPGGRVSVRFEGDVSQLAQLPGATFYKRLREVRSSVLLARRLAGVLLGLRIEHLLIGGAELRPGPGLNAITGETGAGKTVLAHALDLLLGGKPKAGIVRPGARGVRGGGLPELPDGLLDEPSSPTCASASRRTPTN